MPLRLPQKQVFQARQPQSRKDGAGPSVARPFETLRAQSLVAVLSLSLPGDVSAVHASSAWLLRLLLLVAWLPSAASRPSEARANVPAADRIERRNFRRATWRERAWISAEGNVQEMSVNKGAVNKSQWSCCKLAAELLSVGHAYST